MRIDSKVIEDIEEGGTKDETRRLRFILDTVGKAEWPGGKVPEDWSELVRKHNEKAASEDNDGSLKWMDERVPPGRDVRCIVSVAMLAEGWDANTVTHIVGLRPFGSQLLCEQVVGRALRRKSYALNEETQMFAEETAKVFGVPFELIPFKVAPAGPDAAAAGAEPYLFGAGEGRLEISFPIVTGYHESGSSMFSSTWKQVAKVTIDPMRIPQTVELTPLTTPDGALAAYGPGEKPVLSLKDWRAMFRDQQVAFRLAREICIRWQADNGAAAVPVQVLFPKVAFAAKRFLAEKLDWKGEASPATCCWSANICRRRSARSWTPLRRAPRRQRRGRGHPARRGRSRQHAFRGFPHDEADLSGDTDATSTPWWPTHRNGNKARRSCSTAIPASRSG